MTIKLLIDECLWPKLVTLAHEAGYEAVAVRDREWCGLKDHQLMVHVLEEDFTLVTHNSKDFRGPAGKGEGGLHREQPLHCGLICLNSAHSFTPMRQERLFKAALERLSEHKSLVNYAIEVFEDEDDEITLDEYEIPTQ
jgi:predicted nuclease of predicted toxin-antitoxin system